jgi:hypothetical protein
LVKRSDLNMLRLLKSHDRNAEQEARSSVNGINRLLVRNFSRAAVWRIQDHWYHSLTVAPPSAITDASQIVFEPESPAYIIEQDLAKRFGRANFRHYFCISPADILHGPLKKLSNFMLDLGKTLAELRRMALEARDARIEKSQNSKRRPAYPIKDTVTGGDVNFVTDVLQREATKQYRETHWPKRKRSAENEPDDSGESFGSLIIYMILTSALSPRTAVRVIVDDSLGMIKKKRLLCKSRRCYLCGEAETARSLPAAQLQKTQGISRVAERPLFGLVPSDTAAAWNTQAHMGPTPRRIIARRANAAAASIPQSGSGATPAVAASPVPALSAPAPAIPAAAVPSFPAEAIALSAMDNSMIDSFFNIATTQAKGLTKGQEMNLKIGTLSSCATRSRSYIGLDHRSEGGRIVLLYTSAAEGELVAGATHRYLGTRWKSLWVAVGFVGLHDTVVDRWRLARIDAAVWQYMANHNSSCLTGRQE